MESLAVSENQNTKVFPEVNDAKTNELIKRIKRLVPLGNRNDIEYLNILITYLDGLINGDDIHQYISSEMSEVAKKSLDDIMEYIHEHILNSYRQERTKLQNSVEDLTAQEQTLSSQVNELSSQRTSLVRETNLLEKELSDLKMELETLRENGIKDIEASNLKQKEQLETEISSLEATKQVLLTSINDLKSKIKECFSEIESLDEEDTVNWVSVGDGDPIYGVSGTNIARFIDYVIDVYSRNLRVDSGRAFEDILTFAPGLWTINKLYEYIESNYNHEKDFITKTTSIGSILARNPCSLSAESKELQRNFKIAIASIKLPVYKKTKKHIDTQINKVPDNVNALLRELQYQRALLEEKTKRELLESQLRSLTALMSQVIPENYDLQKLIETYSEITDGLSDETLRETPSLKL